MFVMRLSVPVTSYYGNEVFFKEYFFEVDRCPSKDDVLRYIEYRIETMMQDPDEDCSESKEAMEVIELMKDWCYVYPTSIVHANTFVEHPKFGKQPVSFEIINPVRLNRLESLNVYASFTKEQIREIYDSFDETDNAFFDYTTHYAWDVLREISNSNVYIEIPEIENNEEEHFIVFQAADCFSMEAVNDLYRTIKNKNVFQNVYVEINTDDTLIHVFNREICEKDIYRRVNCISIDDEIIL